ncbi:MAG: type VI secretion system baseplate subunit TssE [Aliidongia sp.]
MNGTDPTVLPQLSVLDRLLAPTGEEANAAQAVPKGRRAALRDVREAVERDLEMLLTTRQRWLAWPSTLEALPSSLINYGIPDFSGSNLATQNAQDEFRRSIEAAIRCFEPRFKRVSVQVLDPGQTLDRRFRLRIEALMIVDAEPIVFDSVLDPVTRSFAVRPAVEA